MKSCVGSTWCRFGVQDSVALAVMLELRYRGLRSPHKIKLGVSGCARECAEARGKDVGVIATDKGWNVYVGGNGGFTPRHAQLLAEDLDTETLVRTIDRFLLYYVRTADRLQRTAPWIEDVEGGLDGVRAVVMEDSLGIAADLDEQMALHVVEYEDEWKATLEDPEKLRRFASLRQRARHPRPVAGVRAGARPVPARHGRRARRRPPDAAPRTRPRRRRHPGGPLMTALETASRPCGPPCAGCDDLAPERGAAALLDGEQVALFRLARRPRAGGPAARPVQRRARDLARASSARGRSTRSRCRRSPRRCTSRCST